MNLIREQAIEEHRKMWSWIAEQYLNGRTNDFYTLKEMYIREHAKYEYVRNNCFCCEYTRNLPVTTDYERMCVNCPFIWSKMDKGNCDCERIKSPYRKLYDCFTNYRKLKENVTTYDCYKLAKEIAELPIKV